MVGGASVDFFPCLSLGSDCVYLAVFDYVECLGRAWGLAYSSYCKKNRRHVVSVFGYLDRPSVSKGSSVTAPVYDERALNQLLAVMRDFVAPERYQRCCVYKRLVLIVQPIVERLHDSD